MKTNLKERLLALDSCAVSDAVDRLGLPAAVSGLAPRSKQQLIAGPVRTVKLESANGRTAKHHLCTTAIEDAAPGDIIVIEQLSGIDAAGWGGILSLGATIRGVAGAIVDGPVRDVDEAAKLGFPVYSRSVTARTARGRIIETESAGPIAIGGVSVVTGDWAIADGSGVVFIPAADVERVVTEAEHIARREAAMAEAASSGEPMSKVMGANYEQMLNRENKTV